MRVDRFVRDVANSLKRVLEALDSNITVDDNFGPSGAPEGYILTSVGKIKKPEWKAPSDIVDSTGVSVIKGEKGDPGPQGPAGPAGASSTDDLTIFNRIVTSGGDVVVSGGNVVWS